VNGSVQAPVGTPFPDYELAGLDGRTWQPRDLLGRTVVLFRFSTW
jgi:peroxiredoxin